jgi:hypothetical protein
VCVDVCVLTFLRRRVCGNSRTGWCRLDLQPTPQHQAKGEEQGPALHLLPGVYGAPLTSFAWCCGVGCPLAFNASFPRVLTAPLLLTQTQYSLVHKEMYDRFEKIVEAELEEQLRRCGWAVSDFHAELGKAIEGAGAGEESEVVRAHASAGGLLELLSEVTNYETWADALKRQARELAALKGPTQPADDP